MKFEWKSYSDGAEQGLIKLPCGEFSVDCSFRDGGFRVRVYSFAVYDGGEWSGEHDVYTMLLELPVRYENVTEAKEAGVKALKELLKKSVEVL